nr:protein kinase-like domain, concanavalin A-like lectin/glucanase domain protein [Tanacetum cinerariifolium]
MVPILTSTEFEQHQVNKTQDSILAKVNDAIPIAQVDQMVEGEDVEATSLVDNNVIPSSSTPNYEFLDPTKKLEIKSWLEDGKITDPIVKTDEIEHFDTFPTLDHEGARIEKKPSNPSKNYNFVRRVKGLKVFVGNFTYECNFMILEDTTSIIDHHLGEVAFGKPFVRKLDLVYNQNEGTFIFEKDDEKITFKMPHMMETFNHIDVKDVNTDSIPPFVLKNNDNRGKTYYLDSLALGSE